MTKQSSNSDEEKTDSGQQKEDFKEHTIVQGIPDASKNTENQVGKSDKTEQTDRLVLNPEDKTTKESKEKTAKKSTKSVERPTKKSAKKSSKGQAKKSVKRTHPERKSVDPDNQAPIPEEQNQQGPSLTSRIITASTIILYNTINSVVRFTAPRVLKPIDKSIYRLRSKIAEVNSRLQRIKETEKQTIEEIKAMKKAVEEEEIEDTEFIYSYSLEDDQTIPQNTVIDDDHIYLSDVNWDNYEEHLKNLDNEISRLEAERNG